MERFKQYFFKNFESIIIFAILWSAFLGTYFLDDPSIVLYFYYLPVLVASYFLGRRMGLLTAILSIVLVLVCALFFPFRFFSQEMLLQDISRLSSWGGFLILTSVTVSSLYEKNERRLEDLRNAYIGIVEILSKYLESTDKYTRGHSVRVSELAMEIAIAMDLHRTDVENVRVAGLLHDIGKIEISGEEMVKRLKKDGRI